MPDSRRCSWTIRLKVTVTMRMDKNQNFNALFSPAASLVYSETGVHIWRMSFSGAIRNPTLADQYLYYNVGRALLLGNVDGQFEAGRDSMFTLESFDEYRFQSVLAQGLEQTRLLQRGPDPAGTGAGRSRSAIGARCRKRFYVDVSAYNSWYEDFIGYVIGLYGKFNPRMDFRSVACRLSDWQPMLRNRCTTRGANVGSQLLPEEDDLLGELQLQ